MRGSRRVSAVLCGSLALASSVSQAATFVQGSTGSATWTAAESPFVLTGDVTVDANDTLTILPGVSVLVPAQDAGRGVGRILVQGTLVAVGTAKAPILFQREDGPLSFGWIGFRISGSAKFVYVRIRDAQVGLGGDGTIDMRASWLENNDWGTDVTGTVKLDAVTVSGKTSVGVMVHGGSTVITNSLFLGAGLDGVAREGGEVTLRNCTFNLNATGIYGYRQDMMKVSNSIIANSVRSAIDANAGGGDPGAARLSDSLFFGTTLFRNGLKAEDGGVRVADPGFVGPNDLHLRPGSPGIDTGSSEGAPDHDFDETPRPLGRGVDIGAFEWDPERDAGVAAADGGDAASEVGDVRDAGEMRSDVSVEKDASRETMADDGSIADTGKSPEGPSDVSNAGPTGEKRDAAEASTTTPTTDVVGSPVSSSGCGCRIGSPVPRGAPASGNASRGLGLSFVALLATSALGARGSRSSRGRSGRRGRRPVLLNETTPNQ